MIRTSPQRLFGASLGSSACADVGRNWKPGLGTGHLLFVRWLKKRLILLEQVRMVQTREDLARRS